MESGASRTTVEARARKLPIGRATVSDGHGGSRAIDGPPPPNGRPSAEALRALAEEVPPSAALVALHDDLLFADAAITTAPPPRTGLLSHPEDDVVDALRQRTARERPFSSSASRSQQALL